MILNMIYSLVIILLVAADQFSKRYLSDLLALCVPGRCQSIEILPVVQFTLVHNRGAAFSFLSDAGGWQQLFLLVVSACVSCGLVVWLYRIQGSRRLLASGLTLVIGGAVGNLIDRATNGFVIDFIDVHWGAQHFPIFNLADSAISIGAALLILDMILQWRAEPRQTVK